MAFDENGQADNYERRIEICKRSYKLLTDTVGFPWKILFSTSIFSQWQQEWKNIAETHWISLKQQNGFVKTCHMFRFSGGVSNVSFSFREMIR